VLSRQQRAARVLVAVVVEAAFGVLARQHQEMERDEQRRRDLEERPDARARARPGSPRRKEPERAARHAEQLEGQAALAVRHADERRRPLRERERRESGQQPERRVEDRGHAGLWYT